MITIMINKFLILMYVLSFLTTFRHGYYLLQSFMYSNEETPLKYKLRPLQLFWLGLSLAYIISSIFIGITI
jgi:hypothetical protein